MEALLQQQSLMLEREQKTDEKADTLREEMRHEFKKMRQTMDAKTTEQSDHLLLLALQARLERLHSAKLLGNVELFAIEDIIADSLEEDESRGGGGGGQVAKLVALSEGLIGDAALSRQLRRKFV